MEGTKCNGHLHTVNFTYKYITSVGSTHVPVHVPLVANFHSDILYNYLTCLTNRANFIMYFESLLAIIQQFVP